MNNTIWTGQKQLDLLSKIERYAGTAHVIRLIVVYTVTDRVRLYAQLAVCQYAVR